MPEPHLFLLKSRFDQRLRANQLGVSRAHFRDQRRHQPPHQRFPGTEQVRVAHRPAHDSPKDIAPALVRRQHSVGYEKAAGAKVIGDHAMARLVRLFGLGMGQRLARGDQRPERVRIVIVGDALEHGGDPFEAHSGVDTLARKLGDDLADRLLVLHEDEIPDLDESVAVLVRASWRAAEDMLAVIVKNLRAGSARAIIAHRPESVLGRDPDDPALR